MTLGKQGTVFLAAIFVFAVVTEYSLAKAIASGDDSGEDKHKLNPTHFCPSCEALVGTIRLMFEYGNITDDLEKSLEVLCEFQKTPAKVHRCKKFWSKHFDKWVHAITERYDECHTCALFAPCNCTTRDPFQGSEFLGRSLESNTDAACDGCLFYFDHFSEVLSELSVEKMLAAEAEKDTQCPKEDLSDILEGTAVRVEKFFQPPVVCSALGYCPGESMERSLTWYSVNKQRFQSCDFCETAMHATAKTTRQLGWDSVSKMLKALVSPRGKCSGAESATEAWMVERIEHMASDLTDVSLLCSQLGCGNEEEA